MLQILRPQDALPTALLGLVLLAAPGAWAAPFLYSAVEDGFVQVLDTALVENSVVAVVPTPGGAYSVAVNSAGTRVYVANYSNFVVVIDTASNTVVATVPVGAITRGLAVNSSGTRVYVANGGDDTVSVIDAASNSVVATVAVGRAPNSVAVNAAGTRVYVTNQRDNSVSVFDAVSNAIIATVPVGLGPGSVAVSPVADRAYVTNFDGSSVSVLDTVCNTNVGTVTVGPGPTRVALNPAGTRAYVASLSGTVSVLDTANNTVVATVARPGIDRWTDVAVNSDGTRVYVAGPLVWTIDAANNVFSATATAAQGSYIAFAGAPPPPPAAGPNLRVTGIEVTQGIQDLANNVMLVSGRRTFVRVYVQSIGPAVPGVTAILNGVGNIACTPGTCPPVGASLGPLVPVNIVGTRITARPNPSRNNIDDSFLFELPWLWTQYGSLHLNAVVTSAPGLVPVQSCASDVLNAPLHEFEVPTTLKVQFVRVSYNLPGTYNGIVNAFLETSIAEQQRSESFIRRSYPLAELVFAPDYKLYDAGLGLRVNRTAIECAVMAPDQQSLCARNYISGRLAELQAVDGFNFGLPAPRGSGSITDPDVTYALIPQVPNDPNGLFFTRGACCTNGVGGGPSGDADYAAHEIGHFLGRNHPVQGAVLCTHSAADPNYPYFNSLIAPPLTDLATGLAGFDGGDAGLSVGMTLRPTFTIGPDTIGHYDLMGYCNPSWISDYTYRNLYSCLRVLNDHLASVSPECGPAGGAGRDVSQAPQNGDWLAIFGSISPDNDRADFDTRHVSRILTAPPLIPGRHSIRLVGVGGETLADYPFTPEAVADSATIESVSPSLSFGQVVPFVDGTREIRIVDHAPAESVLGSKVISATPPVISSAAIQGVPGSAAGLVTVSWTASDADGDPLTFDISLKRDLGESSQPLLLGLSSSSVQLDTARLGLGGGNVQFLVRATDDVHTVVALTPVFRLANRPPLPRISSPGDEVNVHFGQLVNIEGHATDPQDGTIPDTGLTWSTPTRSLGSGSKLSITDLPIGANRVALKATNSLGLSESTSVVVNVLRNLDRPLPTLTAGPMQVGWQVQRGELQPQSADLNVGNSGSGNLAFTARSNAPWLTVSTGSGTAPAVLSLTAYPAGLDEGTTLEGSVTLSRAGLPAQVVTVPVTLFVGSTFVSGKQATCSSDVSARVNVTRGGFRRDTASGRYVQLLTLKNVGSTAIAGPIELVLDGLSSNAALSNKAGDTACATPVGPYKVVNVGPYKTFGAGASTTVVLEFANPRNAVIGYRTRLLAGNAP